LPTAPFILASSFTPAMRSRAVTKPRDDVGHFLADGRRARRLTMRAAEHRHTREALGELAQVGDDLVERRQQHIGARAALSISAWLVLLMSSAGAGEVHELAGRLQLGVVVEAIP
jgi:hypothetical protein